MPVILVLTEFDALVSKVGLDIPSGDSQHHGRARASAYAMYVVESFLNSQEMYLQRLLLVWTLLSPTSEQPTDVLNYPL